ncbi:MAG: hypothetical protein II885_12355 [Oscillospiraceae bacterium]|nr:hypothetical protein [Oscillospiraceae bacterium]
MENERKKRPVMEPPKSLQSRLNQGNFTRKPAWRQGEFELKAEARKMASKTGKRRELGEKREKSGENSTAVLVIFQAFLRITLKRKTPLFCCWQKKMRGVSYGKQYP